jgi:3'(2'), 5'-bisphosphate nucleotidase
VVTPALLDAVRDLARAAGDEVMSVYDAGAIRVERKQDDSPLTEADRRAHDTIVRGLTALTPGIPIISEEGLVPPFADRKAWRRFWLVDPLDGTKEFLHRNGEFTVNIALIEDGVPVLGVVLAPAVGIEYAAARGLGSWKRAGSGAPVRLLGPTAPGPEGMIVVESRSHPSKELEAFLATVKVARRIPAGSSLKFGLVAEGAAQVYPRFGPTHDWDVAAGDAVWRNAILEGQRPSPIAYNSPDLLNAGFVIGVLS